MEATDQTTQQLMFSLIEVWKSGNKTQQEFCKEKVLDFNKFQYWLRKYKAVHSPSAVSDSKFTFKQIRLKEQPVSLPGLELVFPDGRKLIFHQPVEASFLRSLLI